MTSYSEIIRGARPWQGVLDTSVMADDLVSAGHRLADAAKAGNWPAVMKVLDREWSWLVINQWRPGGTAWFTALHQAAWHGAPTEVVAELLDRGSLRSLRDSKGRTAFDVAAEHDRTPAVAGTAAAAALTADAEADSGARRTTRRAHRRTHPRPGLRRRPAQSAAIPAGRNPARAARSAGVVSTTRQVRVPHRAATRSPRGQELVRPGRRVRPSPPGHPRRLGAGRSRIRLTSPSASHTYSNLHSDSTLRLRATKEVNHDFDCCTT